MRSKDNYVAQGMGGLTVQEEDDSCLVLVGYRGTKRCYTHLAAGIRDIAAYYSGQHDAEQPRY
jgi:hypothetical protein